MLPRVWVAHTRVCLCQACVWRVWEWREVISLSCVHSPSTPCCLDEVPWFTEHFVFKSSSVKSTPNRPWNRWRDGFGFASFQSLFGLLFEWVLIGKRFFCNCRALLPFTVIYMNCMQNLKGKKWELGKGWKERGKMCANDLIWSLWGTSAIKWSPPLHFSLLFQARGLEREYVTLEWIVDFAEA